jgi:hypothetical protein
MQHNAAAYGVSETSDNQHQPEIETYYITDLKIIKYSTVYEVDVLQVWTARWNKLINLNILNCMYRINLSIPMRIGV